MLYQIQILTQTHAHICMHMQAYALTQICIHTEIHTFLHTQACMHTQMHSCLHKQACITHRHTHACTQRLDLSSGFSLFRVIGLTPSVGEWINFSSPFTADFSFLVFPYFYSFLLFSIVLEATWGHVSICRQTMVTVHYYSVPSKCALEMHTPKEKTDECRISWSDRVRQSVPSSKLL